MKPEQIKEFCQRGGLQIVQELIVELTNEMELPKFKNNTEQLVYEMGKREGGQDILHKLIEKITYYAEQ